MSLVQAVLRSPWLRSPRLFIPLLSLLIGFVGCSGGSSAPDAGGPGGAGELDEDATDGDMQGDGDGSGSDGDSSGGASSTGGSSSGGSSTGGGNNTGGSSSGGASSGGSSTGGASGGSSSGGSSSGGSGGGSGGAPEDAISVLPNLAGDYPINTDPSLYPLSTPGLCSGALDAGIVGDETEVVNIPFSTTGATDSVDLPCVDPGSADVVIDVTPEQPARLRFTVPTGFDASFFFGPDCDPTQATFCVSEDRLEDLSGTAVVEATPDFDYFLVLESTTPLTATGDHQLSLEVTPHVCPAAVPNPRGGRPRRCGDDGTLLQCNGVLEIESGDCPYGCNGDACNGDTCAQAIEILSSAFTFNGDPKLFHDDLQFPESVHTSCGIASPQRGREVVFQIELEKGDQLTVDASAAAGDFGFSNILIKSSCSVDAACVTPSTVSEKVVWTAPSSGTYFIIVDRITTDTDTIAVSFTVE